MDGNRVYQELTLGGLQRPSVLGHCTCLTSGSDTLVVQTREYLRFLASLILDYNAPRQWGTVEAIRKTPFSDAICE